MSLQNLYVEFLTFKMILEGSRAFKRWLDQEGGVLMNEINAFKWYFVTAPPMN